MAHKDIFQEFNDIVTRLCQIRDDVYDQAEEYQDDYPDYEVMNEALTSLVDDLTKASFAVLRAQDTWAEVNENGAGIR